MNWTMKNLYYNSKYTKSLSNFIKINKMKQAMQNITVYYKYKDATLIYWKCNNL